MKVKKFVVNMFQENCYLLYDETGEAALVDPGCYFASERAAVAKYIDDEGLHLRHLLCTHLHPDHIFALGFFEERYALKAAAHEGDEDWLRRVVWYSAQLGIDWDEQDLGSPVALERKLADGSVLRFGQSALQVIHTPGHSRGSVCFYSEEEGLLLSGDTLFEGSVGRTDFPGGSMAELRRSLREKLFLLPDGVEVLPGHGGSTTVGREKATNPYV